MKIVAGVAASSMVLAAQIQTLVLGAGCFWGVQKRFGAMPGVIKTRAGYAGGRFDNPTYSQVLAHRHDPDLLNHAEVVEVVYDDARLSTETLLKAFWQMHDPTQGNRQGNDIGSNYRSAIYYTTEQQKAIALATRQVYQRLLHRAGYGTITTEIKPLDRFYPAEAYHQKYLQKHPNGYCPNHATGVTFDDTPIVPDANSSEAIRPLGGKEIVVIIAPDCPFCEQFEREVVAGYHGTVPLRTARSDQLKGFAQVDAIVGTPTLLFVQDGKVVESRTGYMDSRAFYRALGAFKLGKGSEGYDVAFNRATDRRFCRKYEQFKQTGDGLFVDKISGEPLFDTRDRFNSGSGWLSFYRPVAGAVIEQEDNTHGMHRIEVIAKKSGAHLGHVFDDAPGGRRRYCINATVLEFVPRAKIKNPK